MFITLILVDIVKYIKLYVFPICLITCKYNGGMCILNITLQITMT